jgi:hypothetical protein
LVCPLFLHRDLMDHPPPLEEGGGNTFLQETTGGGRKKWEGKAVTGLKEIGEKCSREEKPRR